MEAVLPHVQEVRLVKAVETAAPMVACQHAKRPVHLHVG